MISKYVDIVFANEEEAKAFTGMEPEDALNSLAQLCETAVVKIGGEGSMIKTGDNIDIVKIDKLTANRHNWRWRYIRGWIFVWLHQ